MEPVKLDLSLKSRGCEGDVLLSGTGTLSLAWEGGAGACQVRWLEGGAMALQLELEQGLKISSTGSLTFHGMIGRDFLARQWTGQLSLLLKLGKQTQARLVQEWGKKGPVTRLDLTIKI